VENAPEEPEPEPDRAPALVVGRRRRRRAGGRAHRVTVRLDDAEFAAIAARAAAARVSMPSFLADAGSRDASDAGGGGGWTVEQRRALVTELMSAQRVLRGVATNLNQLTALANAERVLPPAVGPAAEAALRLIDRVGQVVVALDPHEAKRVKRATKAKKATR
jgi:hypothetical protein